MYKTLLRDNILIEPIVKEYKRESGIILLDGSSEIKKSSCVSGRVIQVGPKVEDVQVGDEVKYNDASGIDVSQKGLNLIMITEADVIACKTVVYNEN